MPEDFRMVDQRQGYYNALQAMNTGTYKGSGDIIDYSLWDSIEIDPANLQPQLMFQNSLGTVVGGAARTPADTNVEGRQGGIPQGSKLYIKALKGFVIADIQEAKDEAYVAALYRMLNRTTVNFKISGKDTYGNWGLDEVFGVSMGAVYVPAVPGDNDGILSVARSHGILPFNLPIVIASNVTFNVQLQHWEAPAAELENTVLKFSLNGILERLS